MGRRRARAFVRTAILVAIALSAACLAELPASAASAAPAAGTVGGQLFSTGDMVEVEVLPASAGLTSALWLLEPQEVFISTNRDVGRVVSLGPFASGTELVFGIRVGGNEFRMGPGDRNPDGIPHATVEFLESNRAIVGFEDLFGGGDRDYDDNRFEFRGGIASEPPPPPPDPPPPPTVSRNPIANAGPDQTVPEGSVVTLDGTASTDPNPAMLEPTETVANLPGGTAITASLSGLDDGDAGTELVAQADVGEGPPLADTAIVFVLDVSGSTGDAGGCGGDQNGDGRTNRILDCEIAAAKELHQAALDAGTVSQVGLVSFSSGASARDLDPRSSASAVLIAPNRDIDTDNILDFHEGLNALRAGGSTNFAAGARVACDTLAGSTASNRLAVFLSDGEATTGGAVANVLPCAPPVTFHGFAVGAAHSCTSGQTGAKLADIANLTGGTCTNVPNVGNLPDILPAVIASRLTGLSLTIDGGDPIDLAAHADPPPPLVGPASTTINFPLPPLSPGAHEVCLTVTGTDAGGDGSVTTCSTITSGDAPLTYEWTLIDGDGPPITLSSATAPKPTFLAADDGVYTFELKVTNGLGFSETDRITVVVTNERPVLDAETSGGFARGVTLVPASFTDPGWLDTHEAHFSWGDGSPAQTVPVTAQGSGWGTFFGSHIYPAAGSYTISVTLIDDDGGTATVNLGQVTIAEPVAVWANSRTAPRSLDWSGTGGRIEGRVHSNNELRFVGSTKTVVGPTTYANILSADTDKHIFQPPPTKAPIEDFPYRVELSDYVPGGRVATEVGAAYHDMTAECSDGIWHPINVVVPAGVYYVPCDVQINGSSVGGRITIAASGHIRVEGSRPAFEPYHDGVLFVAGAAGDKAIDLAASSSKFLGVLFAGVGEIDISGSSNRFYCGILGDRVDMSGGALDLRGAACGRPDSTVAGPLLVPELSLGLDADLDTAVPSDTINYSLQISNDGSLLVIPGLLGLENVDTANATVKAYRYQLEYFSTADNTWVPLATTAAASPGYTPATPLPTLGGISLSARANPAASVTFPASGDPLLDTVVAPRGFATWGYQALVNLTPDQTNLLLDPARSAGLRAFVDFELSPATVQVRRLYTFGSDFASPVRALSGDVDTIAITLERPTGDPLVIDSSVLPELASLAPGASVAATRDYTVPVPAPRGPGETDSAYVARLLVADGSLLFGAAFARAQGGVGLLFAPQVVDHTTEQVPVVNVSKTGPAGAHPGEQIQYAIDLANRGSIDALSLGLTDRLEGQQLPVAGVPGSLAAAEVSNHSLTYNVPAGITLDVLTNRAEATWSDRAGNTYGPSGSQVVTQVASPPDVTATMRDLLAVDADGNGLVTPGDTIRYETVLHNRGGTTLTGVAFDVDPDANTSLVNGSVVTTGGTVTSGNGAGDSHVGVAVGDVDTLSTVVVTFDTVIVNPLPDGVALLRAQGSVTSATQAPLATDDPAMAGPADPTVTRVVIPKPAFDAALTGRVVVDHAGDGAPSPGDTIRYTADIRNLGAVPATAVVVNIPPDPNSTLVPGSVTTTAGTIQQGQVAGDDHVEVAVGALGPDQQVLIGFDVIVDSPLPSGVTVLSVQGWVFSTELAPVLTNDPNTNAEADATRLNLSFPGSGGGGGGGGGGNGLPAPTVSNLGPAEGTIITTPTTVTATLAPPSGETVETWSVGYRRPGDGSLVTLATGTGDTVNAPFDPTVLPNGTYELVITAEASGGGVSQTTSTVVVDGQLKLGRYVTTLQDMAVPLGGVPLQVLRTYDSFDKTVGDFGVGWKVSIASIRVSTNGPLGQGGWRMFQCGGGLIFVPLCFATDRPHYVTITWPDGRNEIFDMTPAKGSTFLSGLTSAEFTGRSGTTSTLEATNAGLYFTGDGNMYGGFFGTDGIYNPTRFRLTDKSGTEYVLDVDRGLIELRNRAGETLTFSDAGVVSSLGPSITYTRDALGRITSIKGPDGGTVTYTYDGAGNLASVTDQNGHEVTYSYVGEHFLEAISDPLGNPLQTLEYGSDGRLVAVIDAEGNRTEIGSDVGGKTQTITSPDGRLVTTATYDDRGNETSRNEVYDGASHLTTFTYDAQDQLTSRTDPLGHTVTSTYNPRGDVTTFTDAVGGITRYEYDANGNLVKVTDSTGAVTRFEYDAMRNLTAIVDALGGRSTATYDARGNQITKTDQLSRVTRYTYDGANRIVSITDPIGAVTGYAYDSAGRLKSMTDAEGGTSSYTYDGVGSVLTASDPTGAVTSYTYDARDWLRTITDPGQTAATTYGYDDVGHVLMTTDPLGATTNYTYDWAGRMLSVTGPTGAHATNAYDGAGNLTVATDPIGRVTRHGYDAAGRQVSTTLPNGATETTEYDAAGNVEAAVDAVGNRTTLSYDAGGRLVSTTDPLGRLTSYTYDALGNQTKVSDAVGVAISSTYDAASQLVTTTDGAGGITRYGFDAAGHQISVTDPVGGVTATAFDRVGRPVSMTDSNGHTTTATYDGAGRVVSAQSAAGRQTTYAYDGRGLLTAVTDGLGKSVTSSYDAARQLVSTTDQLGHMTRYAYDAAGRTTSVTDALGGIVQFGYDAAGQRTSMTDANGKTRTYGYDSLGNHDRSTDPLGRIATATYNRDGQLASATDPRGISAGYSYDAAGQLTTVTNPAGSIAFTYDARGRRTRMSDPTGTTTWSFDGADRLVSSASPRGTLSYGYDAAGRRTSMTGPSGTISYGLDGAGNVTSLVDQAGRSTSFGYNADNQLATVGRPNGVSSTVAYDAVGRVVGLNHTGPSGPISSYQYTLDAKGNRVAVAGGVRTERYTFDALDRLTRAELVDGRVLQYGYDAAGNRTSAADGSATTMYSYDAAGQMTSSSGPGGTTNISYDAAGNVVSAGSDTYSWDWANQLAGATVDGTSHTYAYDGDGLRVSVDGRVQLWDSNGELPMLVGDGTNGYVHGPSGVVSAGSGSATAWPLQDALGSERVVTDGAGGVTGSATYDPYGVPAAVSGSASTLGFGFAGEQVDATGLVHLRARQYDPTVGRFLTADSVQPNGPGTQGWNLYAYGLGNPVTNTDPSGHFAISYAQLLTIAVLVAAALLWLAYYYSVTLPCLQGTGPCPQLPDFPDFPGGDAPAIPRPVPPTWPGIDPGTAAELLRIAGEAVRALSAAAAIALAAYLGKDCNAVRAIKALPVVCFVFHQMPAISTNVLEAVAVDGHPFLLNRETRQTFIRQNRRLACHAFNGPDTCDEYPFASSQQGGAGARTAGAPLSEQRSQGGIISATYRNAPVGHGGPFLVIVVP